MKPRSRLRRRKCRCCRRWYLPEPGSAHRQRYCGRSVCRRASKRAGQRRWLHHNRDYYRGGHVDRVQEWRRCHPGYWRRPPRRRLTIRVEITPKAHGKARIKVSAEDRERGALQDILFSQSAAQPHFALRLSGALQGVLGVQRESWYSSQPSRRGPWLPRRQRPCPT